MIATCFVTLLHAAAPSGEAETHMTPAAAASAVANGEDVKAATEALVASGRRGLWALDAMAKTASGDAKSRLIAAMGRFDNADSAWALLVAYRSKDPYAKAGAVRGMAEAPNRERERLIFSAASEPSDVVRDAVVEAIVSLGERASARVAELLQHESPYAREVALRVIERGSDEAMITSVVPRALADASPLVQSRAIDLAARCQDASQAPALARLALGTDPLIAARARRAIAHLDTTESKRVAGARRYTDPTPPIPGAQM